MKIPYNLTLVILLFCISITSVDAQKFGRKSKTIFGVKGGLNIANQTFSNDFGPGDDDYKLMTQFHLGATAERYFGRVFSVEADFLYSSKGHKFIRTSMNGNDEYTEDNKRVVNYLEIPVQFKASQQLGDNSLAYFAVGPYFSYALSGVWVFYEELNGNPVVDTKEDIAFGSENTDVYRRTDWGAQFNFGIESGPFQVSGGYQWGISNIDGARAQGAEHTNRVIKVSIGYRFVR